MTSAAFVQGGDTAFADTTVADWDTITIGAFTFAGTKITVSGTTEYKIDVKPAPGTDGAVEKPIGYVPARMRVVIELWSEPDADYAGSLLNLWALLVSAYKPKPGKTLPSPVTVDHPVLRMLALSRFYITTIAPIKSLGSQTYEGELQLLEYFAQPKPAGTQTSTAVGASNTTVFKGALTPGQPGASFESTPNTTPTPSSSNTGPT